MKIPQRGELRNAQHWDDFGYIDTNEKDSEEQKYVKHIVKDGARYHVISWHGIKVQGKFRSIQRCSCPNCEINKEWDKLIKEGKLP